MAAIIFLAARCSFFFRNKISLKKRMSYPEEAAMTKGINQKLKMLYLEKIFQRETDDDHGLTLQEITERLKKAGVNAGRKTLYSDFAELKKYGLDIISSNGGRSCTYHLGNREFQIAELKLLVDSVQAAQFIPDEKSHALIGKLEKLASREQGKSLQRQVLIAGRVKTTNKKVYLTVDKLHQAINTNMQVRFHYTRWNTRKELVPRNQGNWFQVSPWLMILSDENYYLAAYYEKAGEIRHYRVDKIEDLELLEDLPREGKETFQKLDIPKYANIHFGMFNGDQTEVELQVQNEKVGIFIDRFGKDIMLIPQGPDTVSLTVKVDVSAQFLGWIMALGEGVEIIRPEWVREKMVQEAQRILKVYK